jgi:transcriptional regulator with XRE-family HTH domain
MSLRSYQSLEIGETKLDLERLGRIAEVLETSMEELLRPEGVVINQEIKDTATGNSNNGMVYNYGIGDEMLSKLLAAKDSENQLLRNEIQYLKEKIDQLLNVIEK